MQWRPYTEGLVFRTQKGKFSSFPAAQNVMEWKKCRMGTMKRPRPLLEMVKPLGVPYWIILDMTQFAADERLSL